MFMELEARLVTLITIYTILFTSRLYGFACFQIFQAPE